MLIDALLCQGFVGDRRFLGSKAEETEQREEQIRCFLQKILLKKYQVSKETSVMTLYLAYRQWLSHM